MFAASTQALLTARTNLSPETHQRRIDDRTTELQREIRALKACRNSRSSAVALPAEILSFIFLLVSQLYRGSEGDPRRPPRDRLYWIRVTHVCAHWRRVALDCVALWTDLIFDDSGFTELMLSRARSAPLTVTFATVHQGPRRRRDVLCRVLAQGSRLHAVSITRRFGDSLDIPLILEACSLTAPVLKALSIRDEDEVTPANFEAIPPFFAGGTPLLESLEIHRCRVSSWLSLPLSTNLTSLKLSIRSSSDTNPARPSWLELSNSLKKLPLLQTLHLSQYLPHTDSQTLRSQSRLEGTPPISLQRLRDLKLDDTSTTAIIDFLKLISQPHTTKVGITFYRAGRLEFLHPFFTSLRASQQIREYGPVQELGIEGPHFYETVMRFKLHSPGHFDRHLLLKFGMPILTTRQILCAIKEDVDISSVSCLRIGWEKLREETWVSIFSSLTMLREITLDQFVGGFSKALSAANLAGGFPALSSLTLCGVDFRMEGSPLSVNIIRSIVQALNVRPEWGPSIDLSIKRATNCTQTQIDALSELLPRVTVLWDQYYEKYDGDTTDEEGSDSDW